MTTVKMSAIRSLLQPADTSALADLSILWHAGGSLSASMNPRPNWSGFMQSVCQGQHSGVARVDMLSIIDLNPSDEDCIFSTLVFVINQAKRFNIPTPNITFDQPLYVKAVDIAMKAELDIVVRLGGFHTLMSFLGSLGHLMKGSGLEELLGLIFGPNTVEHVFTGKACAPVLTLCSCRKHGLHCVSACSVCHGNDCSNCRVDVSGACNGDNDSESDFSDTEDNEMNMPDFGWDVDPCFEYYEEVL